MVEQQRHRLIVNVLSNYGTIALYSIVNFILVGYIVRKVGKEAFGLISLIMSLTIVTELLGRGVSYALTKHLSAAIIKKQDIDTNEFINTSVAWFFFCGFVGAVIYGVVAKYIDRLFDIPPALISDARWAIGLMALKVIICFPFNAFQGILLAHQRYDLANLSKSATIMFRFLAVILFFEFVSAGIIQLVVITIISVVMECFLWLLFSISITENLQFRPSLVSRRAISTLFGFGGFITIIYVANMIGYEAVKWVIGLELSVVDVGGYSLIAAVAVAGDGLVRSISNVLMPVASKYHALLQHDTNVRLTLLSTKYTMVMSSLFFLMPLLLLRPMLTLWVGNKYAPGYISELAQVGVVLLVGQWFITTVVCILQMLNGVGRVRVPAVVTISWAIGGLGIVWAYLHWGQGSLFAAVVGITIAKIIGTAVHMIYGLSVLRIPSRQMFVGSIFRPACAGIILCVISYFLAGYFNVYRATSFITVVIILVIMHALLVLILVLSKSERAGIVNTVRLFLH